MRYRSNSQAGLLFVGIFLVALAAILITVIFIGL
jgi:hypothetical protein